MSGLTLPSTSGGATVLLDPAVQEMVERIQKGYAPLGWEGDERLGLYIGEHGGWELHRLGEDHVMRIVCRSKPGTVLDNRVIEMLVKHDARRGHDAAEEVIRHNEELTERRTNEAVDALMPAVEKLYWGLRKDLGHHY
jgi:hypothetical protein